MGSGFCFIELFVNFRVFCPAENKIHRNIVEIRQADKSLGGDIALASFVL
mgnify:CR=1 FL=1